MRVAEQLGEDLESGIAVVGVGSLAELVEQGAEVADEARVGVQVLGEGCPFERGGQQSIGLAELSLAPYGRGEVVGDQERLRRMAGTFGEIERGAEVLVGLVQLTQAIEAEAHEAQAEYLAEGALGEASRLLELPVDLEGAFVVAGEVGIAGSIVEGAEARRQGVEGIAGRGR